MTRDQKVKRRLARVTRWFQTPPWLTYIMWRSPGASGWLQVRSISCGNTSGRTTSGATMTMNRRHFIMSTAVMTAGATVRGPGRPTDTARMGAGGPGGRGQSHVDAWSSMEPNVQVAAICDVDESHIGNKLKRLSDK